jgi:hypothetical protein
VVLHFGVHITGLGIGACIESINFEFVTDDPIGIGASPGTDLRVPPLGDEHSS